jgi:hypothetical protein
MSRPRTVDLARLGLGVAALVAPDGLLSVSTARPSGAERATVRVLGARYLLQAAGGMAVRRRWVHDVDAAVDLLHAATMVALAAVSAEHRRLALLSALTATAFAAADLTGKVR